MNTIMESMLFKIVDGKEKIKAFYPKNLFKNLI